LAEKGYDPQLGARPLRRTIQRELEDKLSERILLGEFEPGQLIVADVDDDVDSVSFRAVEAVTAPDTPPVELAGGDGGSADDAGTADA
jgi:ATP-dependent Clp protease ATP-binding subunit ClpC